MIDKAKKAALEIKTKPKIMMVTILTALSDSDLKDIGNTVIVVEHDEYVMKSADQIIDMGPRAGAYGGEIIAQGTPKQIMNNSKSLTGLYLSGKKEIGVPKKRKKGSQNYIEIKGAVENNLKNIDVKIPLNKFVCVSGISGSGKAH